MKKLFICLVLTATLFGLMACTNTTSQQPPFTIGSDDMIVRVQSSSPTSQQGTEHLTIPEGYGICINCTTIQGNFHVRIVSDANTTVFDQDIAGDGPTFITDVESGSYNVTVASNNACGHVEIFANETQGEKTSQTPNVVLPGAPSAVGSHDTVDADDLSKTP